MAFIIKTWYNDMHYFTWMLIDFPRSRKKSIDELLAMDSEDDDELWEWQQFYAHEFGKEQKMGDWVDVAETIEKPEFYCRDCVHCKMGDYCDSPLNDPDVVYGGTHMNYCSVNHGSRRCQFTPKKKTRFTEYRKRLFRTHGTVLCLGLIIGTVLGAKGITWIGFVALVALFIPWGEPSIFDSKRTEDSHESD